MYHVHDFVSTPDGPGVIIRKDTGRFGTRYVVRLNCGGEYPYNESQLNPVIREYQAEGS